MLMACLACKCSPQRARLAANLVQYWGAATDLGRLMDVLVGSASRTIAPARVYLRPGADAGSGWAWLVGLPEPLTEAVRRGVERARHGDRPRGVGDPPSHSSLAQALQAMLDMGRGAVANGSVGGRDACGDGGGGAGGAGQLTYGAEGEGSTAPSRAPWPSMTPPTLAGEVAALEALRMLDTTLRAAGARASWTEASFWRSSSVLHAAGAVAGAGAVEGAGAALGANVPGPTLLVGDTCCGRPFWLGSTLNGHFADLAHLTSSTSCWDSWDWAAEREAPFKPWLDRMRTLRKCGNTPAVAALPTRIRRELAKALEAGRATADGAKALEAGRAAADGAKALEAGRAAADGTASPRTTTSPKPSRLLAPPHAPSAPRPTITLTTELELAPDARVGAPRGTSLPKLLTRTK